MNKHELFYQVVTSGLACGLLHPVEWIVNYDRHLGNFYAYTEIPDISKLLNEIAIDFHEIVHLKEPGTSTIQDIRDWIDAYYLGFRSDILEQPQEGNQ